VTWKRCTGEDQRESFSALGMSATTRSIQVSAPDTKGQIYGEYKRSVKRMSPPSMILRYDRVDAGEQHGGRHGPAGTP
jgi:hypothetical protein